MSVFTALRCLGLVEKSTEKRRARNTRCINDYLARSNDACSGDRLQAALDDIRNHRPDTPDPAVIGGYRSDLYENILEGNRLLLDHPGDPEAMHMLRNHIARMNRLWVDAIEILHIY